MDRNSEKAEKLAPFGAVLIRRDTFTSADAQAAPALVIVGDTDFAEAERISLLCCQYHIPVNVVDVPQRHATHELLPVP